MITIKELKEFINNKPDDMPIVFDINGSISSPKPVFLVKDTWFPDGEQRKSLFITYQK